MSQVKGIKQERKLLYTHVVWLRNTCKRRKYLSAVNCREKLQQLTTEKTQTCFFC